VNSTRFADVTAHCSLPVALIEAIGCRQPGLGPATIRKSQFREKR